MVTTSNRVLLFWGVSVLYLVEFAFALEFSTKVDSKKIIENRLSEQKNDFNEVIASSKDITTTATASALLKSVGNFPSFSTLAAELNYIRTLAGTGVKGFSGDGFDATKAQLSSPVDLAVDRAGNIYIADASNNRIRKLTLSTGIISTVAGTGGKVYNGDNIDATTAAINGPEGVGVDGVGNIYITDTENHRIRKVTASTGKITTIAGTGFQGFSIDGTNATLANLQRPSSVAVDAAGNIYIADTRNYRIRKVSASTGIISTVAGTGTAGFTGDGGLATNATLYNPLAVATDKDGNIYIADTLNHCIRKVTASTGIITTIAGTGFQGFSIDGTNATLANLQRPSSVAVDAAGNIYIADTRNYRIRKVSASTGIISTVAGTGTAGFTGDGGLATNATLYNPLAVATDKDGNVYIADTLNHCIRKVTVSTGIITTIAGRGTRGFNGDNIDAQTALLRDPKGVSVDSLGNVYIADSNNYRIRKVLASTGKIVTVAGTGTMGFSGDGVNATSAELNYVAGIVVDAANNFYIADTNNHRVRSLTGATRTSSPTAAPNTEPILSPSTAPISGSTSSPTFAPSMDSTQSPSFASSMDSTPSPTFAPSMDSTPSPSFAPSTDSTPSTSFEPSMDSTTAPSMDVTTPPVLAPSGPATPAPTLTAPAAPSCKTAPTKAPRCRPAKKTRRPTRAPKRKGKRSSLSPSTPPI